MEVGNHAKVIARPLSPCDHKPVVQQLVGLPTFPGAYRCDYFYQCPANEMDALANRHILDTGFDAVRAQKLYKAVYRNFVKFCPVRQVHEWTRKRLLADVSASRKKVVANSQKLVMSDGLQARDYRIIAFMKGEKAEGYDVESACIEDGSPLESKSGRLIQYRPSTYTYELARFLRPLEHQLFKRKFGKTVPKRERWFAKGMTSHEVAENLLHKWSLFADPVALLLDHSKFDAHLNEFMRKWIEWAYYNACGRVSKLVALLKRQRKNTGRTTAGRILYEVLGTMMSGEYNTSLGDCTVNHALIVYFLHVVCGIPIDEFDVLVNGDDSVAVFGRRWRQVVASKLGWFAEAGMKTKSEWAFVPEEMEFCQTRPIEVAPGKWRMARRPERVISRSCYTDKQLSGEKAWRTLIGAVGTGELACNQGVPIVEAFARLLIRTARGRGSKRLLAQYLARRGDEIVEDHHAPVQSVARASFEAAYGFTPSQQRSWENYFDTLPELPLMAC